MPVKGTKALEESKKATVITTYTAGVLIAPAAGHLSVYADLIAADEHRQLEVIERLKNLMDRAREEDYLRPATDTLYYYMWLHKAKDAIQSTIDSATIEEEYAPVDGTVIDFDDGVKEYAPVDGTVIDFVDGGTSEDTITDSDDGFITGGLLEGNDIVITGSTSNNGTYTPLSITAGVITLASGSLAATEEGINGVTFAQDTPALITDSDDGFLSAGLATGQSIAITGSTSNNGSYTPSSVLPGLITLPVGALTATEEGINGVTFKAVSGYVAIGINTAVLSGSRGSLLLDACWKEIVDWLLEKDRITA